MGLIQGHDLSLDCRPTPTTTTPSNVSRSIAEFLGQVSTIGSVSERLTKLDDYLRNLQDEMRKIDAFKRELPLSMLLLDDAVVAVKEEATRCRKLIAGPVLEEFMPLKKSCGEEDNKKFEVRKESKVSTEKMNWLSSAQLWNSSDPHYPNQDSSNKKQSPKQDIRKIIDDEVSHILPDDPMKSCKSQSLGIAFQHFKDYTGFPLAAVRKEEKEDLPGLSLQTPGIKSPRDDNLAGRSNSKTITGRVGSSSTSDGHLSVRSGSQSQPQQTTRKQRRCWSPELHRRFVEALQQLGGSQVATPKQIRELMQVDGLTNDEVKSHLQKYRLHTRRNPATSASTPNQSCVALGGIWPPQDQFGEPSKQSNSQSGSPQGPLQFDGTSRGTSMTMGDSMEDEDDEKSESHSWKSHGHSCEKNVV